MEMANAGVCSSSSGESVVSSSEEHSFLVEEVIEEGESVGIQLQQQGSHLTQ